MFIAINNTYEKHEAHEQNMKNMVNTDKHAIYRYIKVNAFGHTF